jgi:hypothetical protein
MGVLHIGFRLISASGKFLKLERKTVDSAKALRFPASLSIKIPRVRIRGYKAASISPAAPTHNQAKIPPVALKIASRMKKLVLTTAVQRNCAIMIPKGVPKSMQRGG